MSVYAKDPAGRLDYAIDWSLAGAGRPVAASAWSVTPDDADGLTIEGEGVDLTRTRVTLADGQSDERSLVLRVEER